MKIIAAIVVALACSAAFALLLFGIWLAVGLFCALMNSIFNRD